MIRDALEAAAAARTLVAIERCHPGEPRVGGYVLSVSERLVLVHQFHDFYDEGWTVMRIEDVTDVLRDEREQFLETIFHREGLVPRDPPFALSLASIPAALRSIHAATRPVILECETPDSDDDDFFLGMLLEIDDLHAHISAMDIVGHWDDPETIALPRITKLQVETPYLLTLTKYGDSPPDGA